MTAACGAHRKQLAVWAGINTRGAGSEGAAARKNTHDDEGQRLGETHGCFVAVLELGGKAIASCECTQPSNRLLEIEVLGKRGMIRDGEVEKGIPARRLYTIRAGRDVLCLRLDECTVSTLSNLIVSFMPQILHTCLYKLTAVAAMSGRACPRAAKKLEHNNNMGYAN